MNSKPHDGKVLAELELVKVLDCTECGFAHVVPLPSQTEREDFYRDQFYESEKKDYISNHVEDQVWRRIESGEKYDLFDRLLKNRENKSILDIGSGPGFFLKEGETRGWKCLGLEPGESAWRFSTEELRLDVRNLFLTDQNYRDLGKFDVIHLNNVLEHLVDPKSFLKIVKELVSENGLVSVTVPNDFNRLQEIAVKQLKKPKWWIQPTEHLNYFAPSTLRSLIEMSGFRAESEFSSFPMELFLLMGDDYIRNSKLGRELHGKRKQFEENLVLSGNGSLKKDLYDAFWNLGLGRQITVVARFVMEQ